MLLHELLKDACEVLLPMHQLAFVHPRLLNMLLTFREVEAEPPDALVLFRGRDSLRCPYKPNAKKEKNVVGTVAADPTLLARDAPDLLFSTGKTVPRWTRGVQDQTLMGTTSKKRSLTKAVLSLADVNPLERSTRS